MPWHGGWWVGRKAKESSRSTFLHLSRDWRRSHLQLDCIHTHTHNRGPIKYANFKKRSIHAHSGGNSRLCVVALIGQVAIHFIFRFVFHPNKCMCFLCFIFLWLNLLTSTFTEMCMHSLKRLCRVFAKSTSTKYANYTFGHLKMVTVFFLPVCLLYF